jgi:hypothetical protein
VLPAEVPTLAELLRGAGYKTAALVNNGQMRAHWGFARGFETWREFEVDTPASNAAHLTDAALTWLADRPREPYFLFLHYYDIHDPYAAPEDCRRQCGTTLTGPNARRLCVSHRTPTQPLADDLLTNLRAAYDAEIAGLDRELGRLLAALPPDALVVIFSDHGEAFKEHGWLLHGATLYEEEIRVPLLMRLSGSQKARVSDAPAMLLDVMPTILAECGLATPADRQGIDLSPLLLDESLAPRLIPAENKAVLEGRIEYAVTLDPLKAIYSLGDGSVHLYRLPDETHPVADARAAEALVKPLRAWVEGESYWLLHATGTGDYEASLSLDAGRFGLFVPLGLDPLRDSFDLVDEGRTLHWHVYPGGQTKSLFLQPANPAAALRFDGKINGEQLPKSTFLGMMQVSPASLPTTVAADLEPLSPFIDKPFKAEQAGFYLHRHQTAGRGTRPSRVEPLDERTLRQLKSLGYVR